MSGRNHSGSCLRHRRYQMDCVEFAVLVAALGDQCGICGIPGADARPAYLLIDHDHERGDWAVRGMLCSGCNRRIRDGVKPPPEAAAYLADPWYVRRLAERGISLDPLPQPAIGTIVGGRASYWYRAERGWLPMSPKLHGAPMTWSGLNHLLAPYNIWIPPRTDRRYQMVGGAGGEVAAA